MALDDLDTISKLGEMTELISSDFKHLVVPGTSRKPSADIATYEVLGMRTEPFSLKGTRMILSDFAITLQIQFNNPNKAFQVMTETITLFQQDPQIRNLNCIRENGFISILGTVITVDRVDE